MKQLFIPKVGDTITLAEDFTYYIDNTDYYLYREMGYEYIYCGGFGSLVPKWLYDIYHKERANIHHTKFSEWHEGFEKIYKEHFVTTIEVTLQKGTKLTINKMYIRNKGQENQDYINFRIPGVKHVRSIFLTDVNKMIIE